MVVLEGMLYAFPSALRLPRIPFSRSLKDYCISRGHLNLIEFLLEFHNDGNGIVQSLKTVIT